MYLYMYYKSYLQPDQIYRWYNELMYSYIWVPFINIVTL